MRVEMTMMMMMSMGRGIGMIDLVFMMKKWILVWILSLWDVGQGIYSTFTPDEENSWWMQTPLDDSFLGLMGFLFLFFLGRVGFV